MPDWVEDAIWWQVHPLTFLGSEPEAPGPPGHADVVHRLERLEAWLDHLLTLGCNGLALGPVTESSSHGYDTVDYFRIDPRLGDETDMVDLLRACRERGVRVLFDGVFNHVGRQHPAFTTLTAHGPSSSTADWFKARWPVDWIPGSAPEVDVFEGHQILVELDHHSDTVVRMVADVMNYWLDLGIDGWRLDAAYAVPSSFWARVLPAVRERHPDAYIVGEVIHGDYAELVSESTVDAVTQYELWQGIWHGIADRNLHELAWSLTRHADFLRSFVPWTFVGNHDVTRIASAVPAEHLAHALAVLFTVGGTPAVWAGDDHGFRGVKEHRAGGDDAVRPPFPETPSDLSPVGSTIFAVHQQLIGLRRRHRWLHRGVPTPVHVSNTELVYSVAAGDQQLLVVLNLANAVARLPAEGARTVEAGYAELSDNTAVLQPQGWAVLST